MLIRIFHILKAHKGLVEVLINSPFSILRGRVAHFNCRRISASIFVLMFLMSIEMFGQVSEIERSAELVKRWQVRVAELDEGIVSDSKSISMEDKALYVALQSKIWWKVDEQKAKLYLKRTVDHTLSAIRADESNPPKSIETAAVVIDIISKLDEKVAENLVFQIAEIANKESSSNVRKENPVLAQLFVRLGLQVVKTKPSHAMDLGLKSLNYGFASSLPYLIGELNVQSPTFTEKLYRAAMTRLEGNYSNSAILFEINLSKYLFDLFYPAGFSVTTRKLFLANYSDRIALAARDEALRQERCRIVSFSESILPRIDEYVPDRSLRIRQDILLCKPHINSLFQASISSQTGNEHSKSVDELIKAAKEQHDEILKGKLWLDALAILSREKRFAEIISVLDSIDGDDLKKLSPIMWGNWRAGAAVGLTNRQIEEDQIPDAYRTIEKVPKPLRPQVRLEVAKELGSAKRSAFYLDNVDGMIKDLSGIDIPDIEAVSFYLALTELMLDVRPQESESMFRLATKHINKVDNASTERGPDTDWEWERYYIRLDAKILELDETGINSSLESIGSRRSRVRLKLGLLESALKYQAEAKKKYDLLVKAKSTKTAKPSLN